MFHGCDQGQAAESTTDIIHLCILTRVWVLPISYNIFLRVVPIKYLQQIAAGTEDPSTFNF